MVDRIFGNLYKPGETASAVADFAMVIANDIETGKDSQTFVQNRTFFLTKEIPWGAICEFDFARIRDTGYAPHQQAQRFLTLVPNVNMGKIPSALYIDERAASEPRELVISWLTTWIQVYVNQRKTLPLICTSPVIIRHLSSLPSEITDCKLLLIDWRTSPSLLTTDWNGWFMHWMDAGGMLEMNKDWSLMAAEFVEPDEETDEDPELPTDPALSGKYKISFGGVTIIADIEKVQE